MRNQYKFVDLSGYMFSGKAAVSDLIKEFSGFHLPNYRSEFDLIRISGGLSDLKRSFDDWSAVGVDGAVRRFEQIVHKLISSPKGTQKLYRCGFGYLDLYPNIESHTKRFLEDIIDEAWDMGWPYELMALNGMDIFALKVKAKLRGAVPWPEIQYRLCSGDNFDDAAKRYIASILSDGVDAECHTIVTHNALEPYDPSRGFVFFDDIKSIVVDRDIRDIYMTGVTYSDGFNDHVGLYSRILGAFDVDIFIRRQQILRAKTDYSKKDNVLRIQYEDLINSYDDTVDEIIDFLGGGGTIKHVGRHLHFDPNVSKQNVGLWRGAPEQFIGDLEKIENALPDLCYP